MRATRGEEEKKAGKKERRKKSWQPDATFVPTGVFSKIFRDLHWDRNTKRENFLVRREGKFLDFHEIVKNIWRITREYDVVIRYNIIKSPSTVRPGAFFRKRPSVFPRNAFRTYLRVNQQIIALVIAVISSRAALTLQFTLALSLLSSL